MDHIAGDDPEPLPLAELIALREENLRAETDAEHGFPRRSEILDDIQKPAHAQPLHSRFERSLAGEHERIGTAQFLRVFRQQDIVGEALAPLERAVEIADAVVDDADLGHVIRRSDE